MTKSAKTADTMTYAEFKKLPVWRLNGVTDANVKVVKETELWVHYPRLRDEGWGLIADDSTRKKQLAKLKKHGITAKPWDEVTYDSHARAVKFISATAWSMALVIGVGYAFTQNNPLFVFIVVFVGAALFALIAHDEYAEYGEAYAQIVAEEKKRRLRNSGIRSHRWGFMDEDSEFMTSSRRNLHEDSGIMDNSWTTIHDTLHHSPDYIYDPMYHYMPQNIYNTHNIHNIHNTHDH